MVPRNSRNERRFGMIIITTFFTSSRFLVCRRVRYLRYLRYLSSDGIVRVSF